MINTRGQEWELSELLAGRKIVAVHYPLRKSVAIFALSPVKPWPQVGEVWGAEIEYLVWGRSLECGTVTALVEALFKQYLKDEP